MSLREWFTATLTMALLVTGVTASATTDMVENYRKRFPARWLEQNGTIHVDTICYNYPESSYMYRLCREQAAHTLSHRCDRYRALAEAATEDTRAHYQQLADKYCTASQDYQP